MGIHSGLAVIGLLKKITYKRIILHVFSVLFLFKDSLTVVKLAFHVLKVNFPCGFLFPVCGYLELFGPWLNRTSAGFIIVHWPLCSLWGSLCSWVEVLLSEPFLPVLSVLFQVFQLRQIFVTLPVKVRWATNVMAPFVIILDKSLYFCNQ